MSNQSVVSFAVAAALCATPGVCRAAGGLEGVAPATASSASSPANASSSIDEQLVIFEIEAQYAYIETQARMSSRIDNFVSVFGGGTHDTETLKTHNVGGRFRILGPKYGVARPFIDVGGVTPPARHIISGGVYGLPGVTPSTQPTIEYQYDIDASVGIDVSMPVGPSVLSLRPFVGYAWDSYLAKIVFQSPLAGGSHSDAEDEQTVGSIQFGGTVAFQPTESFPIYVFATGGWRDPVQHDNRHFTDQFVNNSLIATGVYNYAGGVFYRAGIGVRF
jgi:hypothetical protein